MKRTKKEKSKIENIDKLFAKKNPAPKMETEAFENEQVGDGKKQEVAIETGLDKEKNRLAPKKSKSSGEKKKNSKKAAKSVVKDKNVSVSVKSSSERRNVMQEIRTAQGEKKSKASKNGKIHRMEDAKIDIFESNEAGRFKKVVVKIIVLIFVIAVGVGSFYYFEEYSKKKSVQSPGAENAQNVSDSGNQGQGDVQAIKEEIGKIMELPSDEEPILATVTDVEKIRTQKFFAKAQNGDRVLIYKSNEKAILYRPDTHKIIEVSQLSGMNNASAGQGDGSTGSNQSSSQNNASSEGNNTQSQTSQESQQAGEKTPPAKVVVYNGSKIKGLAKKIGGMLSGMPEVSVSKTANASGNYEKTLIIDLSGTRAELAQKIAESLGGEVGTLPEGETKPEAEILIIGGSEFKLN